MGLAAGQARLLTITGRKSDCEFESMRLSHQKIALARELADLSNEYQTSLNKTKLVYDFYGTGDTNTPLTYSTLMAPSMLNNYAPTLITDSMGRVVLDSSYAAAAAAAGIPQEGLGSLPSEIVRNQFVQAMASPTSSIITQDMANKITSLPYNQEIGFGGGATVATLTQDVTYNELIEFLNAYKIDPTESEIKGFGTNWVRSMALYDINSSTGYYSNNYTTWENIGYDDGGQLQSEPIKLGDILSGNYVLVANGKDEENWALGTYGGATSALCYSEFWEYMMSSMEELLDTGDPGTQMALEYAREEFSKRIAFYDSGADNGKWGYSGEEKAKQFVHYWGSSNQEKDWKVMHQSIENSANTGYIGLTLRFNCGRGSDDDSDISSVSVNLTNMMKAYLTYFADAMNGIGATDSNGNEVYKVGNTCGTSKLVDSTTMFTIKTGVEVSSDDLAVATFYDTLLNQICMNGWVENNQINDPEYLQQMLQNGMLYISKTKDDGYYYQGNYSIDTYIKEIADEQFIAEAEAKYNTEKAKLNAKEETLDMKMKNLDTEISSLTTEYDTVKNTITKNIEKTFKRYNA